MHEHLAACEVIRRHAAAIQRIAGCDNRVAEHLLAIVWATRDLEADNRLAERLLDETRP